jgi:S1-C subfamily serine protease
VRKLCALPLVLGSTILLGGCFGPLIPVTKLSYDEKGILDSQVQSFSLGQSPLVERRIASIEAISCQNKTNDPYPSQSDAISQLKYITRQQGGDAVLDITCSSEGTNLFKNCWNSVTCQGVSAVLTKDFQRLPSAQPKPSEISAPPKETPTVATAPPPPKRIEPARKLPINELSGAKSSGTGFAVSENAVITNEHVVQGCERIRVGGRHEGFLVKGDKTLDLAQIRVSNNFTEFLTVRDRGPRLNETVIIAGYPLHGLFSDLAITNGNVSRMSGIGGKSIHFQISAPVQVGNSGGPVVDVSGRVIGVVLGKLDAVAVAAAIGDLPQNMNFAVNSGSLKTFLDSASVPYKVSPTGKPSSPEAIGEQLRKVTHLIECF